ncbi:serine/threonine protein kinase [Bremerella cremea]|uniref:Serine/threonine protein kinase n=1 Tax=Blastopirellula marina TaxID=124 RepID=A0A2S8G543_9BACT|nr:MULTISPECIES: PQQ-binding-like beta-propeller repeat protein [Pirellulaceae]PQO39556.1 serine/threonine protein kinase [Blastopirellula marina]RCS51023.1 serine/threonine protein kinase [Bremerella cremea]
MRILIGLFLVTLCVSPAIADSSKSSDWPQWNGVNRDAVSSETGLLQEWPEGGPALAWKATNLGGGDSAPAIADGRIYGMSNRGDDEVVWALSEADGKELWVTKIDKAYEQRMPQSKEGPGGTPTIDGDHMYVMGMEGDVTCLKVADGEIVWQRDLQKDFGGIVPMWSFRESPLIDGSKVIVTPGGKDATMAALNKKTGETIWATKPPAEEAQPAPEPDEESRPQGRGRRGRGGFGGGPRAGAGYSSAIIVEEAGKKQYVQLTAKALIGVDAETGELIWQYDRPANRMGINCTTPVFKDGLIFAASAYGNGGGAVKLKKTDNGKIEAEEVYFTSNMQNHHGGLIVVDGCLYGANGGNGGGFLSCLDFQTGEVLWRDRKAPKGSLAMADGRLYLRSEEGPILLIEPNKEEFVEKGRFDQPDRTSKPAWAHPVIANGKLYIRDQGTLYCYDVKAN